MSDSQFCALIFLGAITTACALYVAAEHAWERIKQWLRDRQVAAAVALSEEPIYAELAIERPDAVEVMSDDWPQWEAEVAQ